MKLTETHKIEIRRRLMYVDGKPFVVDFPDEPMDRVENGRLITIFRGHLENSWSLDEIDGYFA